MLENDFLFGAATSAYQIEGAWNEDGKAPSIWDEISHGNTDFKVYENHTGDVAANHYHQWQHDVRLMKFLGINAYRFSISWSRICTKKIACTNLKGIRFYQNLVKMLKEQDIEPFVTLYHWDLPKWLDDIGGWANPKSIDYFKLYAETMMDALPDVKYWITFNEPAVFIPNFWGHNNFPKAVKNVLLAHGKAIQDIGGDKTKIGISLNLMPVIPDSLSEKDEIAAENVDKRHNGLWLEPIFNGCFPEGINGLYGFKNQLRFSDDEKEIVSSPIDFLGINYYTGIFVKYNKNNPPVYAEPVSTSFKKDEIGVTIYPWGLYELLKTLKKRYHNLEMYITENGCACPDVFAHDKLIHDSARINYMREHLYYCDYTRKKENINLKGYFYWSLMDNFEWLQGYSKRFGLIYVFYPTQSRIPKESYHWYRRIIGDKQFRENEIKLID